MPSPKTYAPSFKRLSPVYPMDGHVHWNIFTDGLKSEGGNIPVCSFRYSKNFVRNTETSVLCDLHFDPTFVKNSNKADFTEAFKENIWNITRYIKADHKECTEILFYNDKEAPCAITQNALKEYAAEHNLSVKIKTPHYMIDEKDKITRKVSHREITVIAMALQLNAANNS